MIGFGMLNPAIHPNNTVNGEEQIHDHNINGAIRVPPEVNGEEVGSNPEEPLFGIELNNF